jgi:hypothetical protein
MTFHVKDAARVKLPCGRGPLGFLPATASNRDDTEQSRRSGPFASNAQRALVSESSSALRTPRR